MSLIVEAGILSDSLDRQSAVYQQFPGALDTRTQPVLLHGKPGGLSERAREMDRILPNGPSQCAKVRFVTEILLQSIRYPTKLGGYQRPAPEVLSIPGCRFAILRFGKRDQQRQCQQR